MIRRVTWSLIEAHTVGSAASGRNGGFMDASLTHGIGNAMARWPDEVEILEELGDRNLDDIEAAIQQLRHRLRLRTHRA